MCYEIEVILKTLKEEFSLPLKEEENRRIIIWNDFDREFEDIVDKIDIEGVKIHKLTGDNDFYTKYLIEEEDAFSNYLIYNPINITDERDNWLIDMFLYSKAFYADNNSLMMRELNISNSLRDKFINYKSFFKSQERRKKVSLLIDNIDTEEKLELSVLAVLTNSKSIEFEDILRNILSESINDDENEKYLEIKKFGLYDAFVKYINKFYGFDLQGKSLKDFYFSLITTVISNYVDEGKLKSLKKYINKNKPNCLVFIDHWINHLKLSEKYEDFSSEYEREFNIDNLTDSLDVKEYKDIDVLRAFDRGIITYIANSIMNNLEDYDTYIEIIKNRRTKHFYKEYENIYEALICVIQMYKFYKKYKSGIPQKSCEKMFRQYIEEFYKMDFYYRKFYYFYDKKSSSDVLNKLKVLVENLYVNWFLGELGLNWTRSIDENMKNIWHIDGIENQRNFYKKYIHSKISKGERVFVIISDALRYEIGVEISEKLNEKVINSANVFPMLSTVPSITKLGMASLLPNNSISLSEDGRILVDGIDSRGIENRNKILNMNFKNSIAVDYHKIPKHKDEFIEYLKGYKLIYIYHDTIDATGDKGSTEIYTVDAVERSINEILDLVHKITTWLGGINIFITSDHGFIYQRSDLENSDKIGSNIENFIDRNRRSVILKENREFEDLIKIDMKYLLEGEGYYAYMPKSNIRFKMQGEGAKFVHGGLSLQEIAVPVVEYKFKRNTYKDRVEAQKAEIKLINESRKITNSIFTLNLFQTEKISEIVIPAVYDIYMTDDEYNIISNIETIIADLKSERPDDRVIKVKLVLKAVEYDKNKKYYLIIKDKETKEVIEEIAFNIKLSIVSHFDF
ncbi:MAG: BREX-1 system phosphatase PglZ type A [Caloramator sp.]|nr:BREX-1 system phosphatase PglZ type A [Caloramator sp.]